MTDRLEKKFERLLSQTAKLTYYKEKAQKSEQDLQRSVEFMRSALYAIQREFHDETVQVSTHFYQAVEHFLCCSNVLFGQKNQDSRCAERDFIMRILEEEGEGEVDLDQIEDEDPLMLQQTFLVEEDRRMCEMQQELQPLLSQESAIKK